jgi:poly(3-hydroxybutyrate) depolymerase
VHSTLRTTVSSAIVDSMISATIGAWSTINTSTIDYWFGAFNRRATPFDLARDLANWTIALADRQRPPWAHENTIVKEWPSARLRDYSAPDADPTVVATVILPPQAGHDSSIVDFAEDQSQVLVGRDHGCPRIYSMDWIGATQETKDITIDDYMAVLREAADMLGGTINLVGNCQGGWLATIFAALYPEKVNSLAIAGAPIDFHAGEPLIHDWLKVLAPDGDLSFFRSAVESGGGVLPGRFLLDGFKAMQPDQELSRSLGLLTHIHDSQHVDRHRKFENWFQWTQALPGNFYLWAVEHLFMRNSLIKGELVVEGRKVNLADISCPLFLMAGQTDHITPPDQVWALADYVSTPAERIGRQSSSSGHLGLFMGHEALQNHWTVIFQEMGALSTPTVKDDPDVLTDEPTHSHPTHWGESPAAGSTRETARTSRAKAPAATVSAAAAKSEAGTATAPVRKARTPRKASETTVRTTAEASTPATPSTMPQA